MKSTDRGVVEDAPRRPVRAAGLPNRRPPPRQASRRRSGSTPHRVRNLLIAAVLVLIAIAAGLWFGTGTDSDVARAPVVAEAPDGQSGPPTLAGAVSEATAQPLPATSTPAAALTSTPIPVAVAVVTSVPTRAATAAPTPAPSAAAVSPESKTVWVANTGGTGAYVRRTPALADRLRAYSDATPLTMIGDDVADDAGQSWKHVRAPDGLEGYVPAMYTTDATP